MRVTLTRGLHRFPISKAGIAFHYWSCLIALIQTLSPIPLFLYLKSLQQTNETITHNKQQCGLSFSLPTTAAQTCSQNTYFWGNTNKACHDSQSPIRVAGTVHSRLRSSVLRLVKCVQNPGEVSEIRVPSHPANYSNLLICFHLLLSYYCLGACRATLDFPSPKIKLLRCLESCFIWS